MEKRNTDNKIISFNEIEKKLAKLKKKNKLIVHCHGVFDLLHPGHLMHFKSAKKFGDILIVSVTSDKFVNKGFNRPYFDINTRIKMISEMSIIDFVCESNFPSAVEVINKIKPNIYCKGPDYKSLKDDYSKNILNENKAIKLIKGKIGSELTVDQGIEAAQVCAINIISQVKSACKGDLNKIKNCIKITGFVNSTSDFIDQPKVINGASELLVNIFEESGKHSRAAVSVNSLPLGAAVEIEAIFEIN